MAREPHPTGDFYYYGNPRWTGWQSAGRLPHPKSPEHDGHLVAVDIDTGEIRWRHSTRLRSLAAALTTAGGLVVTADGDRYLYINDVETGDVLFQTRLPSPPQGFPITYAAGGRQYLAIPGRRGEGAGGAERAVRLRPAGAGDAVMSSDGSTAGTSRSSGGKSSVTPSTALLNRKLGTSLAPRMLTPSEIALLQHSKKEMARGRA